MNIGVWRAQVGRPHLVDDGALLPPPVDPTLRASGRWLIPTPNVWCLPFGAFDGLMLPPFPIVATSFFRLGFLLRSNLSFSSILDESNSASEGDFYNDINSFTVC